MKPDAAKTPLIHSVKNGLRIIRLFTLDRPEIGITEISQALDLPKSTVHRLVLELQQEGYLDKCADSSRYKLGLSLLTLSGVIITHMEIIREAKPVLEELTRKLGEASHIAILEDMEIIYLHKIDPPQPVPLLSSIGRSNPAVRTSAGKCILAYQSKHLVRKIYENSIRAYSADGLPDWNRFLSELKAITDQGYAVAIDQLHIGATSIGAPVKDYTGQVIAAVSVVGPTDRIPADRIPLIAEAISKAAAVVSEKLGYYD
ncbi:IclR family transcriptional regulator [Ferviditalea candida]|uniref:IclR family transcriptional regulator n=1 Tax=Ferviditalea candida TaxID=3108399 RepID=A0ABU5ZET0_9BACL|nr:IclR family transcriptional regulator [Paenibacillaceae bacterium T2]